MTKIQEALYPYQKDDVEILLQNPKHINGNPMGLGKTIEAMALIEKLQTCHNLVVVRKSLILMWKEMLHEWLEEDNVATPANNGHKLRNLNLNAKFVIVNYDILPNYQTSLYQKWDCIIFDECHKLKNHSAKRTRAAYLITPGIPRILFMSGTPMQNNPSDLFPLFHMMDRSLYKSYKDWIDAFCETELIKLPSGKRFNQIKGGKNLPQLRQLLHKHMIRHEKEEVLPQLPPKTYKTVPIELGPEKEQYEQMEKELWTLLDNGEKITAPAVIAQLIRLRQICLEPMLLSSENPKPSTPSNKTRALLELLEGIDSPIVIFTYFEQYTRVLAAELTKYSTDHVLITGKVDMEERQKAINSFQAGNAKVALTTIGMGEGITLTTSHICIFTDLFYNPAVNWQCEDRLHRIGQKDNVLVIDLYNQGTVEDAVHQIVRRKQSIFNDVVAIQETINKLRNMRTQIP